MRHTGWAILLTVLLSAVPAPAQSSRAQQASTQFRAAEKAEASLYDTPAPQRARSDYLRVIRAYERVYLITPHTAWADNALTSIARLYEEMKDPRNAVKTLQFLLNDYPRTPFREVAERDIARLNSAGVTTVKEAAPKEAAPKEATPKEVAAKEVSPKDVASIENIRFWEENQSARVVVELAGDVTLRPGEAKSPARFFVDVFPARLNSTLSGREWILDSKVLQKIRVAQFDLSTVRIVLDGATLKDVITTSLKNPSRIVLDVARPAATSLPRTTTTKVPVVPVSSPSSGPVASNIPAPAPASVIAQPAISDAGASAITVSPETNTSPADLSRVSAAKPTNAGNRSLIRSLGLKLSRVVIDAGHGGHDFGSIGPTGFTEKELVLDVAKRLKILIESQMGAEVVMTRDIDAFVSLESRTQLANDEKADLFISIHANSSTTKAVRGVETFFLNLNTQSRDALSTAARENAASEKKIHELQDILQKIVLNDKTDESRELAQHVQSAMSKRSFAGTNRGVKQAPFVVLIGASMPSILAEVSFITNPEEERRLKTPEYRQQIAESLLQGIKSYSETLSSTKTGN
jgi:N-acetylmuramoyl-L-alanine amidase